MKKFLLFLFCCAFIASLAYNYYQWSMMKNQPVKTERKTEIKYIEKKDSMPEAKSSRVVGRRKIPLLVSTPSGNENPDSMRAAVQDSTEVEITQKVYSDDSTYTAYVSGVNPNLDSIFVKQKEVTNSILETRTLQVKKFRRWNVGLIGGYGYGLKSKNLEPFIGVGITISLIGG